MSSSKKTPTLDTSYIKDYQNYLKNYDTGNVDNTLSNLTNWASTSSADNLGNMGNYNFSVEASDRARQQAQDATYNSYMNYMQPKFETQASDLATALQNKGLSVGSEAYSRAMNDLQDNQNQATNQAAQAAVLAGQNAYSQDLQNQIAAGNFGNNAQQSYINQLVSALQGSASGYENQQNLYSVGAALANANYQNALAKAKSKSGLGSALGGLAGAGIGAALGGGPLGASVGASVGSAAGGSLF